MYYEQHFDMKPIDTPSYMGEYYKCESKIRLNARVLTGFFTHTQDRDRC